MTTAAEAASALRQVARAGPRVDDFARIAGVPASKLIEAWDEHVKREAAKSRALMPRFIEAVGKLR